MTRQQRDKAWQRVTDLIAKHGRKLTRRQLDKALSVWDTLAKAVVTDMPAQHLNGGTKFIMTKPTFIRKSSPYTAPNGAPLTGYQLAAQKAGLDINTPGLENMTFDEMKELALGKLRESTEPLKRAAGLRY